MDGCLRGVALCCVGIVTLQGFVRWATTTTIYECFRLIDRSFSYLFFSTSSLRDGTDLNFDDEVEGRMSDLSFKFYYPNRTESWAGAAKCRKIANPGELVGLAACPEL